MKPGKTGIARIIDATTYSYQGLLAAFKYEAAFRQELILFLIAAPLAFFFAKNAIELILLIASVVLVLIVELLNSAIESVVDRISSEKHELSGRAKDIGSAAVFISLVLMGFIWLFILFF